MKLIDIAYVIAIGVWVVAMVFWVAHLPYLFRWCN